MIYPPDIEESHELWGANCGPCSVASILDLPVSQVRELFIGFEKRGYANITHIKRALLNARVNCRSIGAKLPQHGLAFIQWGGHEKKPPVVQYQFTHWIAVDGENVFEVNAPHLTTFESWKEIMPQAVKDEGRSDGTFTIRAGIEVFK